MNNLNKLLFIITFFIFSISLTSLANEKEKMLFVISGTPFTTIDLNQRINYLKLFNEILEEDIKNKKYLNDLISVMIFNKFASNRKIKTDNKIIEDYYKRIINSFENNNNMKFEESIFYTKLSKDNILKNIRFDLQRQEILKILLNENENNLSNQLYQNELLNTFDIKFNYFIIQNKYLEIFEKNKNLILYENTKNIHKVLFENEIEYDFYNTNISNFSTLDKNIRLNILNNINEFVIYQNDYLLLGKVIKKVKKNIDLKYSFFQIEYINKNNIVNSNINCDNIINIKKSNVFKITQYDNIEIEKLNTKIIEKLLDRNDSIFIENDDQKYLLLLCNKNYNNQLAENLTFQENIQKKVDEIEKEFISLKKNEYNFKMY